MKQYPNGLVVHQPPSRAIIAEDVDPGQKAILEALGLTCTHFPNTKDQRVLNDTLRETGAHLAITRTGTSFGEEAMRDTFLQAVQGACKGPHVDKRAAQRMGIDVLKVDTNRDEVVALTMATLRGMVTGLLIGNNLGRKGVWGKKQAGRMIFQLEDLNLGIIGYGDIGQALAVEAGRQGIKNVWAYNHRYDVERDYDKELIEHARVNGVNMAGSLDELLAKTNVMSLHIDETDAHGRSNQNFMTADRLREWGGSIENGPKIFLNIARGDIGPTLKELNDLLREEILNFVMVDAHEKILEAEGKFKLPEECHPGLITTPHIGGSGPHITRRTSVDVGTALARWIRTGGFRETRVFPHISLKTGDLISEGILGLRVARSTKKGTDVGLKQAIESAGFIFRGDRAIHDLIPGSRDQEWEVVPHVIALQGNGETESAIHDLIKRMDGMNADGRRIISARFIPTTPKLKEIVESLGQ